LSTTWTAGLIQTLILNQRLPDVVPSGELAYAFKAWILAALPLLVMTGSDLTLQSADVLIVSRYMTPTDVAIYFAAAKTMALIMFVHYAVGSAGRPSASSRTPAESKGQKVQCTALVWLRLDIDIAVWRNLRRR
jgi:O-antigen/teichoic acid export membrane protein